MFERVFSKNISHGFLTAYINIFYLTGYFKKMLLLFSYHEYYRALFKVEMEREISEKSLKAAGDGCNPSTGRGQLRRRMNHTTSALSPPSAGRASWHGAAYSQDKKKKKNKTHTHMLHSPHVTGNMQNLCVIIHFTLHHSCFVQSI